MNKRSMHLVIFVMNLATVYHHYEADVKERMSLRSQKVVGIVVRRKTGEESGLTVRRSWRQILSIFHPATSKWYLLWKMDTCIQVAWSMIYSRCRRLREHCETVRVVIPILNYRTTRNLTRHSPQTRPALPANILFQRNLQPSLLLTFFLDYFSSLKYLVLR